MDTEQILSIMYLLSSTVSSATNNVLSHAPSYAKPLSLQQNKNNNEGMINRPL
jgi:hypothetical protein